MKSTFGKNIIVSVWGGSHEPAIGVDIEGIPIGTTIDMNALTTFLARRAPGNSPFATKRKEPDIPIPVRGLAPLNSAALTRGSQSSDGPAAESGSQSNDGPAAESRTVAVDPTKSSGQAFSVTEPCISFEIRNTDTRSQDYKALRSVPRPGHADYTARLRYGDALNMVGGGPFSARMTAPLCIAGGIALQMLERQSIHIGAHIYSIGAFQDTAFDPISVDASLLAHLKIKDFPVIHDPSGARMQQEIINARDALDSVGGVIEACALGLPGGVGGAMYDGLESALSPVFFGIPAVKGVEFGAGFGAALLKGSENNDAFYYDGNVVKTRTNHAGGILGGITTGMPLIARLAFKPTPSISREQDSVDLDKKENTKLIVKGRHDPCVVVRAVPIVEAALALGILDCMTEVN